MINPLKRLFSPAPFTTEAHLVYSELVNQSRQPWFYREAGVPDTLDGRFDLIVLHLFLLIHRLRGETAEETGEFIRALSEVFFADMDRSLREMGSSDTGVGKRVKNMAQAFYGRLQAYEHSLAQESMLKEALLRNVYRDHRPEDGKLGELAAYAMRTSAALEAQSSEIIMSGKIIF